MRTKSLTSVVPDLFAHVENHSIRAFSRVALGVKPPNLTPTRNLRAPHLLTLRIVQVVKEVVHVLVVWNFLHNTVVRQETVNTSPVEDAVKSIADDPLNAAIKIGAFMVAGPAGLAIASGTISLAQGNSLGDALKTAGKAYVVAEAGNVAGAEASAAASNAGASAELANIAKGVTSGATKAGLGGGDVVAGGLMGGAGSAGANLAKDISNEQFANAMRENANAQPEYSPTEQDVLAADPSIQVQSPLASADQTGTLNDTTTVANADQPATTSNLDAATVADASATTPTTEAPLGNYDPLLTTGQMTQGLNLASNAIIKNALYDDTAGAKPISGLGSGTFTPATATAQNAQNPNDSTNPYAAKLLAGSSLAADSTGDPYELERLKQLYGSITPEYQTASLEQTPRSPLTMATGGTTSSSTSAYEDPYLQAKTGLSKPMIGGGTRKPFQMTPLTPLKQRLAHGGLPAKYAEAIPAGHKPEFITGLTGYYASGKGTGQSDDIDAMLHDGDYVADADLVAALGDGSSKAGAAALEKFRRQVPHSHHAQGGAAVPAKIADGEYVFPASKVTM